MDPNEITSIDLRDPQTLIAMIGTLEAAPSFLLDTYFPCNPDTDIFNTAKVIADYDSFNRKLGNFIKVGSVGTTRDPFYTDEFAPARISNSRTLTIDDLSKRGFGEAVFSGLTPAARQVAIVGRDLINLMDMSRRSQEKMAADCLQNDGYDMQYVDKDGSPTEKVTLAFHGDTNDCLYTPGVKWDASGAKILADLRAMSRIPITKGCSVSDVILGSDAAALLQEDEKIMKMLDNRRYEMGQIDPKLQASGAVILGLINVDGVLLRLIQYMKEYEDDKGVNKPFIPPSKVIMTAPGAGKALYGAVTQIDEPGGPMVTHRGQFVPKFVSDQENDIRKIQMSSCPLLVPKKKGCWVCADVVTSA